MTKQIKPHGCVVCGHPTCTLLYPSTVSTEKVASSANYIPTYNLSLQHGELSSCDNCGFIFVSDQPAPETYEKVYANMEDETYLQEVGGYQASFRLLLKELEQYRKNGAEMLEVGCGPGTFLNEARKDGWSVHGIELSKWMVREAGRLLGPDVVVQGGYQIPHPQKSKFDVIVAIHVVEHVPDPADFLVNMRGRLKENGVLYLVTPDIGSLLAKIMGEKWWYIQIPHIYYFNRKWMRRILEKHGFQVERIASYPRFITNHMVSNRIDFLPTWLRPVARFFLWPFLRFSWAMKLNTGDQMSVRARLGK